MKDGNIPEVSEFGSVDPAPPSNEKDVEALKQLLNDEKERMFVRMRSVFALRNIGGKEAVEALCSGFSSASALLRHELAYVLGQMQDSRALPALNRRLEDLDEHVMVRHEAAEAMGAIGNRNSREILNRFLDDPSIEVAESCEVALDLLNHHQKMNE